MDFLITTFGLAITFAMFGYKPPQKEEHDPAYTTPWHDSGEVHYRCLQCYVPMNDWEAHESSLCEGCLQEEISLQEWWDNWNSQGITAE